MVNIEQCPVCEGTSFSPYLSLSDYFLSGEKFNIVQCNRCSFRFTNPRPEENELGKYYESPEYISHANTHKGLFSIVYQSIRKYTIRSKFRLIAAMASGTSLLDIGCATGELISYFAGRGWNVKGIEPNEKARKFAVEEYGLSVGDESWLDTLDSGSFDVVTMWHVLEHVPDINGRIQQVVRLLNDNGILLLALPNPDSWDANHYGKYWAGYDVPRHLHHFSKKSVRQLLQNHSLICVEEIPMKFDAFYVSFLSEKYRHGKKNWLRAFLSGISSNWKAKKNINYSSMIFVAKMKKTENKALEAIRNPL